MKTEHEVEIGDAREAKIQRNIDLVVTSPPYPMIEMWDEGFSEMNEEIGEALERDEDRKAFDLMHEELNKVWDRIEECTSEGSIVCINVGDATRKIGGSFSLYPNGARIIEEFEKRGFESLPKLIWRKPTNSPTKFMGSGMLPPSAYVTLEHEHILIFRKKGGRRQPESENRSASAYFWEERNKWFTDLWEDIRGTSQSLNGSELRDRSAAYPFEIPHRLINMFSVKGDWVLDPFWGTGTTTIAAMVNARNSIGIEIEENFTEYFSDRLEDIGKISKEVQRKRLRDHKEFCEERMENGKEFKYQMENYDLPATTKQEKDIVLHKVKDVTKQEGYTANHEPVSLEESLSKGSGQSKIDDKFNVE